MWQKLCSFWVSVTDILKWKRSSIRRDARPSYAALNSKEKLLYGALGAGFGAALGFLFYGGAMFLFIGAAVGGFLYPVLCREEISAKHRRALKKEFKNCLYTLGTSVRAGKSLENAICAYEAEGYLREPWLQLRGELAARVPVGAAFTHMAETLDLKEARELARLLCLSVKSDGDFRRAFQGSRELLEESLELGEEMEVLFAQKQFEQKIINLMPFLVVTLLKGMSESYLTPLYTGLRGRCIMSACLLVVLTSFYLSKRFTRLT